jgi:hypothetical protein
MIALFLSSIIIMLVCFSNCSLLFKIKGYEPQCLGGEYMEKSIIFVKYKIFTPKRQNLTQILPYMNIFLRRPTISYTKLNNKLLIMNKGKLTFKTDEAGLYEVCIQTNRYSAISDLKEDLFVNMKIIPDYYSDEEVVAKSINVDDIDSVNQKTKQIIALTRPIIDNQQSQMDVENELSLKTLSNASFYKYLTFGQLFLTIIIGIIQVNNFRRFLKSLNII